jgi:hypothetical protein
MQSIKNWPIATILKSEKFLISLGILLFLSVIFLTTINAISPTQPQSLTSTKEIISQQTLASEYGVEVKLIAVTAAGGMIDLRLALTDGEKARSLLSDQANFPKILTSDGTVLQASQDIASQGIKFENGNHIYIFYPNVQNVVKPGDSVSILFGDIQVEPIETK